MSYDFTTIRGRVRWLDFSIVDEAYPKNKGMLGYNFPFKYSVFIDFTMNQLYFKPLSSR